MDCQVTSLAVGKGNYHDSDSMGRGGRESACRPQDESTTGLVSKVKMLSSRNFAFNFTTALIPGPRVGLPPPRGLPPHQNAD